MTDAGDGGVSVGQRVIAQFGSHPGVAWRERMKHLNVTQAQMARRTGSSAKHINQILQGAALPSPQLVAKMARVLHENDEPAARHEARVLFNIQGMYLIQSAFAELNEEKWIPKPDVAWGARSDPEEREHHDQ